MDGSVRFIKSTVNYWAWYAIATPNYGEVFSSDDSVGLRSCVAPHAGRLYGAKVARARPLIWPLGTATHDAAIAGCLPPILAPADADLPGKPDPADRAAGLDRVERDPFGSARTSAQAYGAVS